MKIIITRKLALLLIAISFSIVGGVTIWKFNLIDINVFINPEMNHTQISNSTIINPQINIYNEIKKCPECTPQLDTLYMNLVPGDTYKEDIRIISPDGKVGVLHSAYKNQVLTIGACLCNKTEIVECNFFLQYVPEKIPVESNYSAIVFNRSCIPSPLPH